MRLSSLWTPTVSVGCLYKCHFTADVRSCVDKQTNTDVSVIPGGLISVIPGGLTSHLQPVDVSWNKPFKTAYKEKYSQWMATVPKTFTADGNVRASSKALCLQWVKECWEVLLAEIIQKSFCARGISVITDRTEDEEIHCLKEGGVAADARESIRRDTATFATATDTKLEESDVEEDKDELEENELVLEDC